MRKFPLKYIVEYISGLPILGDSYFNQGMAFDLT